MVSRATMEDHRKHLAENLASIRAESTATLVGLETNADLFAEEAEEIAKLLWETQRDKYQLQRQYDEAIEWKNAAIRERDVMWAQLNASRDDGAKRILTKYLNRMRFLEVGQAILQWRDNIKASTHAPHSTIETW